MGSDHSKMLVFYPLLKSNYIFCHIPYFLNGAAALNIECIKDILCFCPDCLLICNIISDRPHLLPVELFCVEEHSVIEVCLINIQIHHTRIWSSDLRNVSLTESSSYLSSLAPVFDLSLNCRISAFYNACDNRMSLACSLKVSNCLAYSTACIAFTQPGGNVSVLIIQRFDLLNVYKNNRNIQITDRRKHVVGCCVCQHLKKYKVNICCTELISCHHCLLFCCHHSAVNDLYCIRDRFLECVVLCLKFRHQ